MIRFSAVGDVMMDYGVEESIKRFGANFPFQYVAEILNDSDLSFCNLEAPLTNEEERAVWDYTKILDKPIVVGGKTVGSAIYCKVIPEAVKGLKYAGFDVVSIANNHIMDYGAKGLSDTIVTLSAEGIKPIGSGKNLDEARKPAIFEIKGLKIAFLAYCDVYLASKETPGTASTKYIKEDVKKLRDEVDIIVVSMHNGMDAVDYPLPNEIESMHSLIDSGVDLILRSHPHVIQGVEHYKKGVIAYSLGNFIFDYTIDPLWKDLLKGRESMIFQCNFSKEGITGVQLTPTVLNEKFQATIASGEHKTQLQTRINEISTGIGSNKSNAQTKKVEDEYAQTQSAIAVNVMITSIKKGKFKNILLMIQRIRPYHIKILTKYLITKITPKKNK